MRNIRKNQAPQSLLAYKRTPGADYEGLGRLPAKSHVKESLLDEQGHLCCYCMRRIQLTNMKVEHWKSQKSDPGLQLDYGNMLAACMGNQGAAPEEETCDTRKADSVILFNPANPTHNVESRIAYTGTGRIFAPGDDLFDEQLNEVLNLNEAHLVDNRSDVVEAVHELLDFKAGRRNKRQIQRFLQNVQTRDQNGRFKEYLGVAVYFLNKYEKSAPL